jgi:hypothetical protein
MIGSEKVMMKTHDHNLRQSHGKLFNRVEVREKKRKGPETFFDLFKEDLSDPLEKALESKATWGQMLIINKCMFALGLFGLAISSVSYQLEFYEEYDGDSSVILSTLLWLSMATAITEAIFLIFKLKLNVKLHVYRKEAREGDGIFDIHSMWEVLPEI